MKTIKSKVKNVFSELKNEWPCKHPTIQVTFKLTFILVLVFFISYVIYTFMSRGLMALALAHLLLAGGLVVGGTIAAFMYIKLRKIAPSVIYYLFTSLVMLGIIFSSGKAKMGNYIAMASTVLFFLSLIFLCIAIVYKCLYKRQYFKNTFYKLSVVVIFIVSGFSFYYVYFSDGFVQALKTNASETLVKSDLVLLDDDDKDFEIVKGVYGNEKYLNKYDFDVEERSHKVSIANFLGRWSDARETYLEHNIFDVPLNAQFFVPKKEGKYPLVLIAHGNHEMSKDSEIGYNYLGEYLSSKGYVVVSVDENFLNYSIYENKLLRKKLGGENDARAYVMIEHLQKLLQSQNDSNSIFYHKIDEGNIALIGHSRGGEAVSIASFFNNLNYLPNTFRKRLNYGLNIKSIVAIAPTDKQYQPANRPVYLENVNYLLLHGSHDMDVYYFAGSNQYERINYTNDQSYFKAQVYIYGANHGQFNETWTASDMSPFPGMLHNTANLIKREDQEKITKEVIYSFFEASLKGKTAYKNVFRNINTLDDRLPDTLYMTQYHASTDTMIADFNEDVFLETTTMEGGKIRVKNIYTWREGSSSLQGKPSNIYGAYIGWHTNKGSEFIIEKDLHVDENDSLFLSIADASDDALDELIDFTIRIVDAEGNESMVPISQYAKLQNKLEINISKFSLFEKQAKEEIVFQTFELPFAKFKTIDLENIKSIALVFNLTEKGEIMMKDIGIRH